MFLNILVLGDVANNFNDIRKFLKKSKMKLINFPRKGVSLRTYSDESEFFDSIRISKQVEKVSQIKNEFDICIVNSWAGARVVYLAGLEYIMYFIGDDIRTPPFLKNRRQKYLNESLPNLNIVERLFYKKILDEALCCVASSQELFDELKKYRKKDIKKIELTRDVNNYNENVEPMELTKEKFTFFCPHRNGPEKGTDIIWKALPLCKTDFQVLMVDWFDRRNENESKIVDELLKNKPKQVKFIPVVKKEDMPRMYKSADAVIGQMQIGYHGATELEAAFCKKPVVHYSDPKIKYLVENKEITTEFLPQNNDPKEVAKIIDQVVKSNEFRTDLMKKEFEFVNKISSPYKIVNEWEELIEEYHKKLNHKPRFNLSFTKCLILILEKLYYNNKMKEKNIVAFGEKTYEELT